MQFNFRSELLSRYVNISIVLPTDRYTCLSSDTPGTHRAVSSPGEKRPYRPDLKFQTVYLLHGGGDDNSMPYRYTNAEFYAQENNVMLVTPDIANSMGADTEYGVAYESFLTQELPVVIRSLFPSSDRREDNFIVGFAMGGNAALSAAIRHPELYRSCIDISGGIGYTLRTDTLCRELDGEHFRNNFPLYNATFGSAEGIPGSRHDLYRIAAERKNSGRELCTFHLLAGSEEGFIRERVEDDAAALSALGYDIRYTCVPGYGHDFRFWDYCMDRVLRELLPLSRFS